MNGRFPSPHFSVTRCAVFLLATFFAASAPGSSHDLNLRFNVYYLGMRVGNLVVQSADSTCPDGSRLRVVHLRSKTGRFAGTFFRVANSYTVIYDPQRLRLLRIQKSIRQSNVSHNVSITYTDRKALLQDQATREWRVSGNVLDVVSLMDLLSRLAASDTTFTVPLDQEAAPMEAWVRVYSGADGRFATAIVRKKGKKIRRWKTDLLTNRFSKEGARLELRFRPGASVPYELRYSLGPAMATARLISK